jgi:hypothetical protein
VVYAKPPFSGPEAVLAYLSRYTHRVAISNRRLLAFNNAGVTFRYKDYRSDGGQRPRVMTISTGEFIRRFLLHVLPRGFHRIRHYGLLASSARKDSLARARELLAVAPPPADELPRRAARYLLALSLLRRADGCRRNLRPLVSASGAASRVTRSRGVSSMSLYGLPRACAAATVLRRSADLAPVLTRDAPTLVARHHCRAQNQHTADRHQNEAGWRICRGDHRAASCIGQDPQSP